MLSRVVSSFASKRTTSVHNPAEKVFSSHLKNEIESKYAIEQNARKIVELYDSDGDGKISLRESGMETHEFARWDINGDGFVSVDEIKILWPNMGPFNSKSNKV